MNWTGLVAPKLVEFTDTRATYTLGVPVVGVAGQLYRLCWAPDPMSLQNFSVEIDDAFELVRAQLSDACDMTRPAGWCARGKSLRKKFIRRPPARRRLRERAATSSGHGDVW